MSEKTIVNKREFEVEVDGKELKLAVVRPNNSAQQAATLVYNRMFRQAVSPPDGKDGALVRAKMDDILRTQKLWDDVKQARYEQLVSSILAGERKLAQGGIKLSEGREIGVRMRIDRNELRQLNAARNDYDSVTAEAQAEQARFNYLVAACTVRADTGKAYFEDVDDYLGRVSDPVVLPAASNFGKLVYGLDDDFDSKLPENKFLLKYKFSKVVDGVVVLTDKAGNCTDEQGKRVDEKGRYINEAGELIDRDGNPITEDGDYKVNFVEFIDDAEVVPNIAAEVVTVIAEGPVEVVLPSSPAHSEEISATPAA